MRKQRNQGGGFGVGVLALLNGGIPFDLPSRTPLVSAAPPKEMGSNVTQFVKPSSPAPLGSDFVALKKQKRVA